MFPTETGKQSIALILYVASVGREVKRQKHGKREEHERNRNKNHQIVVGARLQKISN